MNCFAGNGGDFLPNGERGQVPEAASEGVGGLPGQFAVARYGDTPEDIAESLYEVECHQEWVRVEIDANRQRKKETKETRTNADRDD